MLVAPAMTLLDTIVAASTAAAGTAGDSKPVNNFPILLDPVSIIPSLSLVDPSNPDPPPARLLTGWQIPASFTKSLDSISKKAKNLRRKLKAADLSSREEVHLLLDSFPFGSSQIPPGSEVLDLVVEASVTFEHWGLVERLVLWNLVGVSSVGVLLEKLMEKNRADLVCLCSRNIKTLRPSHVGSVLSYFLSPLSEEAYEGMVSVRKTWQRQCLAAVEKATKKGGSKKDKGAARDASILLMMAHDGFSAPETCLHHLFSSENLEGLIMSSAVAGLGGDEVLGLVKYFKKWLEKYERFPEAAPYSAENVSRLGLDACEWVPSLEEVSRGLGLVLDEHYSYLVLNPEFHEEIKSLGRLVSSFQLGANACCYLSNVIENLPLSDGEGH